MSKRLRTPFTAALAAFAAALLVGPALADSSASSALSNSVSTSVGSISNSFERSSNSSTDKRKEVAAGEYLVVEIAEAAGRSGDKRLKLHAVEGSGAEGEFILYVPEAALAQGHVAAGQVLSARTRPYGVEFAQGEPRQAFFLLMADDWYRELRTTRVVGG